MALRCVFGAHHWYETYPGSPTLFDIRWCEDALLFTGCGLKESWDGERWIPCPDSSAFMEEHRVERDEMRRRAYDRVRGAGLGVTQEEH